jgi:mono/diheme cytochrome c family protein
MLIFNRLWQFFHPVIESRLFRRVTNDRFLLAISGNDPKFSDSETSNFLRSIGAQAVETVKIVDEPVRVPRIIWIGLVVLAMLLLVPPFWIIRARASRSDYYPIRLDLGMRYQSKVKTQTAVSPEVFADGIGMRRPVAGTVAHGDAQLDALFYEGRRDGEFLAAMPPAPPLMNETGPNGLMATAVAPALPIDMQTVERGRQRFNIYCAPCHGMSGTGNGPVNIRAELLAQSGKASAWVKPTSLSEPASPVRAMTDGQVFHTITYGARSMKGYEARITPADRWAIVLYVRALQKSQMANPDDMAAK